MWLSDVRCAEMVEASWSSYSHGHGDDAIIKKVEQCGKDLTWWNHNIFGNVRKELAKKKEPLVAAEMEAQIHGQNARLRALKEEINTLLDNEAHMWSQRSHTLWLKNGDNNTKFFHCQATKRSKKNLIHGIMDEDNNWRVEPDEIATHLINYQQELFTSSNPISHGVALEYIPRVITDHMNATLAAPFQVKEVKEALKQMAPLKAPGPDGIPPLFYRHFQGLVDNDVTNSVLSWLNLGTIPYPLNHTFVTLIPKTKNPEYVSQYRPISLCNVLYKIFSKVLANRLKKILPTIITEHQSAFVKNRLIFDNILVAFESLNSMKNISLGKTRYMAIKLDMSKAYERVEQGYLKNVMTKMGFNERWIGLIMVYVKIVTYSIIVNGEPQGLIHPTRGIPQGNPLCPFLFLLCIEGIHGLIQHATSAGEIKGFSLCKRGPALTHLLFADNRLLF